MAQRMCSINGCNQPHHAKGLCNTHHIRQRRYGDPLAATEPRQRNKGATCQGPQCERPAVALGLCGTHDMQRRAGNELTPIRVYKAKGKPCEVKGCDGKSLSEGLCQTHYRRKMRGDADWDAPIVRRAAHGEGHIDKNGYRIITVNGRPKREHRHVMEQLLGRRLLRVEEVHHLNGDRADNRVDGELTVWHGKLRSGNLELWSSAQPAGQEVPAKVKYAREILALYGDLVPEQ